MVGGVLLVVTHSGMKRTGTYRMGRNVRGRNVQGRIVPVPKNMSRTKPVKIQAK
jgi:hypothetical protein